MPINFDSIANLSPDLQRIFAASIKAESKPIQSIEERKGTVEEKLKLVNTALTRVEEVKKLIPNLNSPLAIRELNVNSTDDKVATGSADKALAEPGEHSLEVLQLASNATALSNRFPDKDQTRIGSGYFTFYGPDGDSKEVFIDNENATLEGIARVINQASVGMKASVVNDQTDPDAPFRLILSANGYGKEQTVEYPEFYFIDGDEDFFIEEEREAGNAKIRYQGFDIEAPSNELKDLIAGVTLNLKGTTPEGKPLGIAVEQDIPKTVVKMKDIVTALNGVFGFIQEQNKMDADTPGYKTLGGDYGIRLAEQRLRTVIQQNFVGSYDSPNKIKILSDMGIEFKKDGLLSFDEKKFSNALDANFDEAVNILTGDGFRPGFMGQLSSVLSSLTAPGSGVLSNQKATYQERVQRMNQDIQKKEKSLEKKAELLKDKLAKMQGAFNQMQSQQNAIGGLGGGGAPLPPAGGGGPGKG
jgi:flagellar hook-associated protein 2